MTRWVRGPVRSWPSCSPRRGMQGSTVQTRAIWAGVRFIVLRLVRRGEFELMRCASPGRRWDLGLSVAVGNAAVRVHVPHRWHSPLGLGGLLWCVSAAFAG